MNRENNICKMDGKYYTDIISWIFTKNGYYELEECIVNSARAFYLNMMNERIDSERWKARHRLKQMRKQRIELKRNIMTFTKKRKLKEEEIQEIKDEIDKEYFNKYEVISVMIPDAPECIDRYLKNYFEDLCGYEVSQNYINIKVRLPIKENKDNMGVN
jgi:hypothetical protein